MELDEFPGAEWQHPAAVRDFNRVFEPGGGIEVSAQWMTQSLAEQQDRIAQIVAEVPTDLPGCWRGAVTHSRSGT